MELDWLISNITEIDKIVLDESLLQEHVEGIFMHFELTLEKGKASDFPMLYDRVLQHFRTLLERIFITHKKTYAKYFLAIFQVVYMHFHVNADEFEETPKSQETLVLALSVIEFFIEAASMTPKFRQNPIYSMIRITSAKLLRELDYSSERTQLCIMMLIVQGLQQLKRNHEFFPEFYFATSSLLQHLEPIVSGMQKVPKLQQNHSFIAFIKAALSSEDGVEPFQFELFSFLVRVINKAVLLSSGNPNFGLLFEQIQSNLREVNSAKFPEDLKFKLGLLIEKIDDLTKENTLKSKLHLEKEKNLVKIKQLEPRIESDSEKWEEEHNPNSKTHLRKLKKAVNREKKRATTALRQDAQVLQLEKQRQFKQNDQKKEENYHKFMKFMDEQVKEEKRIKTTQMQHKKRDKNKSRRMGGNKTDKGFGGMGAPKKKQKSGTLH